VRVVAGQLEHEPAAPPVFGLFACRPDRISVVQPSRQTFQTQFTRLQVAETSRGGPERRAGKRRRMNRSVHAAKPPGSCRLRNRYEPQIHTIRDQ
jgi:hypothetical protein